MIELFLDYQTTLELKELGFKEKCLASYYTYNIENFKEGKYDYRGKFTIEITDLEDYIINTDRLDYIACPLICQVFDWFRKEHNLLGYILFDSKTFYYQIQYLQIDNCETEFNLELIQTHQEAELKCIKQLITILKEINE